MGIGAGRHPDPGRHPGDDSQPLTTLDIALDGRLADWHGLDPQLDPATLADRYPVAARGDDWLDLRPPEPLAGLRVWSRAGHVVLVELDQPVAPGGAQAVLAALGPAELTQPARFERYGYETTDHVYPHRGLVLITAVAYDHGLPGPPPDQTLRLARAELFVPSDLESWRQDWGDFGRARRPRFA